MVILNNQWLAISEEFSEEEADKLRAVVTGEVRRPYGYVVDEAALDRELARKILAAVGHAKELGFE